MRAYRAALGIALALALGCEDNGVVVTPADTTAPARVTDLAVDAVGASSVTLRWTAPGDDGSSGTASLYLLKRSTATIDGSNFFAATTIAGVPAPSAAGTAEVFEVTDIDTTLVHYFALRARDEAGNFSQVSNNAVWTPRNFKVIPAFLDNTIYEESDTLSNGLGAYVYAGNTALGNARRALLAFAIADSLPAGATVDSVSLRLNISRISGLSPTPAALHVVLAAWGEGASLGGLVGIREGAGRRATPGDATWLDRFRGTSLWTNPGGDFNPIASASTNMAAALGPAFWTSPQLAADVQAWLDAPATNFGWILVGNEVAGRTAREFESRHNGVVANRPALTVFYTVGP